MTVELLTLGDMRAGFGREVGEKDPSNSRWDNDDRDAWINEGQLDFVRRTRILEAKWTSAVTAYSSDGDEVISIPSNCFSDGIITIYWLDSDDVYHPLSEYHPFERTIDNSETGTPSEFFRIGDNLHLKPKPDADGTVVIVGHRKPDKLVAFTDQSLIPANYRHGPVLYAVRKAHREDDEYTKYALVDAEYKELIAEAKRMVQRRRSVRQPRMKLPRILRA